MGGPSPNSVWWSVQCSRAEKETIDRAARRKGISRNRLVKDFIADLADEERKVDEGTTGS